MKLFAIMECRFEYHDVFVTRREMKSTPSNHANEHDVSPSSSLRRMGGSLFEVGACAGDLIARLDQIQFGCPFDGRTTIIDAEFVVDTLGM